MWVIWKNWQLTTNIQTHGFEILYIKRLLLSSYKMCSWNHEPITNIDLTLTLVLNISINSFMIKLSKIKNCCINSFMMKIKKETKIFVKDFQTALQKKKVFFNINIWGSWKCLSLSFYVIICFIRNTFSDNHKQIAAWLWFVYKITGNNCHSPLLDEFACLSKISILTWRLLVISSQKISCKTKSSRT